ncbi:MAG: hypothetical protein DRQ48_05630 [Gammaproteobacteria bacterium]|nr:MAG: hypothetical protein DRQ48_05630 [Gammaproteobacteria bacterium]
MRHLIRLILTAVLLLPVFNTVNTEEIILPEIIIGDDRIEVDTSLYPWRAIGRVNKVTGGFCTGTLISARRILTAAHCLWNKTTSMWLPPCGLRFLAGYQRGYYNRAVKIASIEIPGNYQPNQTEHQNGQNTVNDWAVLNLAEDLDDVGSISIDDSATQIKLANLAVNQEILQAGYNKNRPHLLTLNESCKITSLGNDKQSFTHQCDIANGDSGSPILVKQGDEFKLIGIHVATLNKDGIESGFAVSYVSFSNWIRENPAPELPAEIQICKLDQPEFINRKVASN